MAKSNEELVKLIQKGENVTDNMIALYDQNKGMIYKVAKKYAYAEDMADLLQEAYIGLLKAVRGYKEDQERKFITYMVVCIDRHLQRYIQKTKLINISIHKQEQIRQLMACTSDFTSKNNHKPTAKELAKMMKITVPQVEKIIELMDKGDMVGSLDEKLSNQEDANNLYAIIGSDDGHIDGVLDKVAIEELWKVAKHILTPREYEVIELKYKKRLSIRTICNRLQKSIYTIYDVEGRAMDKLSCNAKIKRLAEDMEIGRAHV